MSRLQAIQHLNELSSEYEGNEKLVQLLTEALNVVEDETPYYDMPENYNDDIHNCDDYLICCEDDELTPRQALVYKNAVAHIKEQ